MKLFFTMRPYKFLLFAIAFLSMQASAQEVIDDIEENSDTTEVLPAKADSIDPLGRVYPYPYGSAFAKRSDSTWIYLLQRPPVAKHFKEKKFGDHLFLEIGAGFSTYFARTANMKMSTPGFMGGLAIGDWITPEHGARLGFTAGEYKLYGINSRAVSLSADYMMNLTALNSRSYDEAKPIELYAIAGVEFGYSNTQDHGAEPDWRKKMVALGARMGVRGQFRLSDYTYAYVEPRLGFYTDNLAHVETLRGFRPVGSVMAGFGYRMLQTREDRNRLDDDYKPDGSFLNDMFFSISGGPSWGLLRFNWLHNNFGGRMALSGGKWFNHEHGARITFQASKSQNQFGVLYTKFKTLTVAADYMVNLHNVFGGYKEDRRYWMNGVAGISLNNSSGDEGHKTAFGFGAGLQANVRIAHGVAFFLEPRVDVYGNDYATYFRTTKKNDAYMSLMAGISFHQGLNTKVQRERNDDFEHDKWWDNLEFEGAIGSLIPMSSPSFDDVANNISPKAFMAAGKWLTATSGVRLWAESGRVKSMDAYYDKKDNNLYKMVGVGIDYMWNATNTFHGYNPGERPCELITTLGVNRNKLNGRGAFYGLNASVKGVLHVNKIWGFFVEPQLRYYKDVYVAGTTPALGGDLITSVVAGLQVRAFTKNVLNGGYSEGTFKSDRRSFVSLSAGVSSNGNELRYPDLYAFVARISYGRWFSPVAAWRVNIAALERNIPDYRHYAKGMLGGDLLYDVNAVAFGYDEDRIFTTRVVGGFNFGVDYHPVKTQFIPDVHAGLQFAFRINDIELFAEPQLLYQFKRPIEGMSNLMKFQPTAYFGVNYRFGSKDASGSSSRDYSAPEKKQFASAAIGTGLSTQNFSFVEGLGKRLTFSADVAYGRWLNGVSGFRVGLSNSMIRLDNTSNKQLSSLHADYMVNLLGLTGGNSVDEDGFKLLGFAGVTGNTCSGKDYNRTWGIGLEAGFQLGVRIPSSAFEVFAEPSINVISSSIMSHGWRPAEADIKLMVGTKYYF